MKILFCGNRHWPNYNSILSIVRRLIIRYGPEIIIIEGGAPGADLLARKAAAECGIQYKEFPANWAKHGRKAGPIRNQQMLEELDAKQDMVVRAKKKGVPVYIIKE